MKPVCNLGKIILISDFCDRLKLSLSVALNKKRKKQLFKQWLIFALIVQIESISLPFQFFLRLLNDILLLIACTSNKKSD